MKCTGNMYPDELNPAVDVQVEGGAREQCVLRGQSRGGGEISCGKQVVG